MSMLLASSTLLLQQYINAQLLGMCSWTQGEASSTVYVCDHCFALWFNNVDNWIHSPAHCHRSF